MARYHVAQGATGIGGNTWASVGDLTATLNHVITNPSPTGDEIWARQGIYSLTGSPLSIVGNTAPLSIYGGFRGNEQFLCQRDANIISNDPTIPNFFQNPSILDGGGVNRVIEMQNANVCRIDGFVVRNGRAMTAATGLDGGGVWALGNNFWFENIVFVGNEAGNFGGGIFTGGWWDVIIKNSIFFDNHALNGGGLCVGDGKNTLLVNLLFNANRTIGTTGSGAAIYLMGDNTVKIINNTIADNVPTNTSVYCTQTPNVVEIFNSILYPDGLVVAGGANAVVDYCCLGTNPISILPSPPIIIQVPPNLPIGTNPNFVNPVSLSAGGDYNLSNTATLQSPCIDRGNTRLIFPFSITDLEGKPRFINGGVVTTPPSIEVDMGALEV